jgi:biotin transport system substrate-specific component
MADDRVQVSRPGALQLAQSVNARRVMFVLLFALLTTVGARLSVPIPGTQVPITMQTLMVTLAGALLGPYLGAASQLAYLGAGAAGLPVFAMGGGLGYLFGPTGGYLLAYPLAAALTGLLCARGNTQRASFLRIAVAMLLASLLILALGWAQLSLINGNPQRAFELGVLPFLLGDLLKVTLGALITLRLRPRTLGLL